MISAALMLFANTLLFSLRLDRSPSFRQRKRSISNASLRATLRRATCSSSTTCVLWRTS